MGLTLFAIMLVAIYGLFQKVPTSFVPDEDQGYVFGVGIMPDGASLDPVSYTHLDVYKRQT